MSMYEGESEQRGKKQDIRTTMEHPKGPRCIARFTVRHLTSTFATKVLLQPFDVENMKLKDCVKHVKSYPVTKRHATDSSRQNFQNWVVSLFLIIKAISMS